MVGHTEIFRAIKNNKVYMVIQKKAQDIIMWRKQGEEHCIC